MVKIKKDKKHNINSLNLIKFSENPIISAKKENDWESCQVFNPGAILLEDKVHILYRAIGQDGISRFGYAASNNGFKINKRLPQPIYEHSLINNSTFNMFSFASGGSIGGCEDPRLVRVGQEDVIYLTYTACDQGLRMGLTSIKIKDFLNKKWRWKAPVLISPPGQVHKNWVIFPEKINGQYAILHSLNPQISIDFFDDLEFDGRTYIKSFYSPEPRGDHWNWESRIRGVGPPPLKTKKGWLIFYHAEDRFDSGKYKIGALLLDLKEPTKILAKSKGPILEPIENYENEGFKSGIIYATGAIIRNNNLLIYYGGADSYVCVAWTDLEKFLIELKTEIR